MVFNNEQIPLKPTTKMKYLAAIALLASGAAAFAPTALVSRTSALSMAPAGGSPAASHEEDLDKTYKVCAVSVRYRRNWGINDARCAGIRNGHCVTRNLGRRNAIFCSI